MFLQAFLFSALSMATLWGQDRARDAPFSCEPVAAGSIVFRGVALDSYTPDGPPKFEVIPLDVALQQKPPVHFQVRERFFGVPAEVTEYEVSVDRLVSLSEEPRG